MYGSSQNLLERLLPTGYPIERYVGWAVTSSKLIFFISGVIPLLENYFLYLKILPRNLWIDLIMYSCIANILNIKHQITIILYKKVLLIQFKKTTQRPVI